MKNLTALLVAALATTVLSTGYAQDNKSQEPTYSPETKSSVEKNVGSGSESAKDTSRQKVFNWQPITVPSGNGFAFSQRVSGLAVSIIEQKGGGGGKITTLYAASGTLYNGSEDDKHGGQLTWTIEFLNSAGTVVDSFRFYLPWDHCTYHGEEPFNEAPRPTSFNLYDVIVSARATGYKPGGYEGGC